MRRPPPPPPFENITQNASMIELWTVPLLSFQIKYLLIVLFFIYYRFVICLI